MMVIGVWLVMQLLQIMSIADLASPLSALVMTLSVALTATLAMKIHSQMDRTFRRTMLGDAQIRDQTLHPTDVSASTDD
jgi:hypothetical protein